MTFVQPAFLLFFASVVIVYWRLPHGLARHWFLLSASLVFYGSFEVRGLVIILSVSFVAWLTPLLVERYKRVSRAIIIVAIAALLFQLGVFKYYNFFINSASPLLALWGLDAKAYPLSLILPVGISFYTFMAISYIVDHARGILPADRDPVRVFLYMTFFPHLVAGPIVRADDFMPQLFGRKTLTPEYLTDGARLFVLGFVYKAVIADNIAPFVDKIYSAPADHHGAVLWLATLGFHAQIYFDFAGYTTMAIGIARLLGYWLPDNFNFPYLSTSVSEFWHRWHISLSRWLRDYLYIPLGGNRQGKGAQYRNLMITMLLGGLWHGASWQFVLWGGLHGAALIVNHLWRARAPFPLPSFAAWVVTQVFIVLTWVPFRATTWADMVFIYRQMFAFTDQAFIAGVAAVPAAIIILPLVVDHLALGRGWVKQPILQNPVLFWALVGAAAAVALIAVPLASSPFIYIQF
jgi:alginate O-acetyltransferase complex protein AlgI